MPTAWWQRLHAALMPDYNAKATVYWWGMVACGAGCLALALAEVLTLQPMLALQVALGIAVTMLAGMFPVRIAATRNSFSVGEICIFLLLLIHGAGAAALAAAAEAALSSGRTSKRWTSRLISPAIAGTSVFAVGTAAQQLWLVRGRGDVGQLMLVMMGLALSVFVLSTLLATLVPRLKRNERLQWSDSFGVFGGVGLAYVTSGVVSTLLYLTYRSYGPGVLIGLVPLMGMLLATLHFFFRQRELAENARKTSAEAADRERELAQRHVLELQASERRFHSAFTHASIGMALLAFDGSILQANPALRALLGRPGDELAKLRFQDLVLEEDRLAMARKLGLVHEHEFEGFAMELRCRHADGSAVWVAAHCSFFSEPGASTPCLILQLQDITARRRAEEGLHQIAFHDALTGLPNRRRFHEVLSQAVSQAQEEAHAAFAVMFLDFDRFKLINDSLGHSAGDEFLVQVSRRIRDCLRPQDMVARLGGDEFAVLVRQLEHESLAVGLADRLMEALRQPFHVANTELMTSASVGITFSALGYTRAEDVLRDADTAMYKAKGAGKARYALFDASLHTEVASRLRLEGDLRRAIDEGRLTVAYQPIYQLGADQDTPDEASTAAQRTFGLGRVRGFEVLVRWQHPKDGNISPGHFLPIAEEAGLMIKLTDFVMNCACQQLREWQQGAPPGLQLSMNVNVSGHDLAHPAFLARVTRAIVEAGLQPQQLCLELTENILMSRLEGALPVLAELQRLGVGLAIDDFGTGYSSLSHLSSLPIDCLKIDRSFVARLEPGSKESAVVRSIVVLGNSLGKSVVAEGIETRTQLEQLRDMGCPLGQGYFMARPIAARDVPGLLGWVPAVPGLGATDGDPTARPMRASQGSLAFAPGAPLTVSSPVDVVLH
jgi:diguanylate cyclase (GGDEF)-like protein/PAS domain S-box-containing protein